MDRIKARRLKEASLPIEYLYECFEVDFTAGRLIWKVRPREHFATETAWKIINKRNAGKAPDYQSGDYRCVTVGACTIMAHRILWAMRHGVWPDGQIDHADRNSLNNSIGNLRPATQSEQNQNSGLRRNKLNWRGVEKHGLKFRAYIGIGGRKVKLGSFDTPEAAHARYLEAKAELHVFQPALNV